MTVEVFNLAVVHDGHAEHEGYTYWHVRKIMERYRPDLIMIETGPGTITKRDFRFHSPEKWGVILPWGEARGIPVCGLDGDRAKPTGRYIDPDIESLRTEDGKRRMAELDAKMAVIMKQIGDLNSLFDTYERAHSERTQSIFRQTHTICEGILGIGPQSANWTPRNRGMVKSTLAAIQAHGAKRVLVTAGCEHKYALDDMFAEIDGFRVLQLPDFLTGPIELTAKEGERFRKGDSPIVYPNELMLIHRRLHGGEPYSYTQALYPKPDHLDVSGILEIIDGCLEREDDPDMHYYRGLFLYFTKRYSDAAVEFGLARGNRLDTYEAQVFWELATVRLGQIQDLLGRRDQAVAHYEQVINEGLTFVRDEAQRYLSVPFTRPSS